MIGFQIDKRTTACGRLTASPLIFFPFFVVTACYNWDAMEMIRVARIWGGVIRVADAT